MKAGDLVTFVFASDDKIGIFLREEDVGKGRTIQLKTLSVAVVLFPGGVRRVAVRNLRLVS